MNSVIRAVVVTTILLSSLLIGCTSTQPMPTVVNTINKDPRWHEQFLQQRITELQPADGQVRLTGNVFGSPDPQTQILPTGYTITFPDHHGTKSYTINSITDRGVLFQYKSVFSHVSFGKNLVETDEGQFVIPWIAEDARQETSPTAPTAGTVSGSEPQVPLTSDIFAITLWPKREIPMAERLKLLTSDAPVPPSTCWLTPSDGDDYFKDWTVTPEDVKTMLATYHQVTAEQWKHSYSHVAHGERSGWLILNDGRCIQWMMKPGGLGWLRFANKEMFYLAASKVP